MCGNFENVFTISVYFLQFISYSWYLFTVIGDFCTDISKLERKKSKKMRSRSKDNIPDVTSNVHLQNSVDNSTVHYSSEHHSVSETDKKHIESPAKLESGQKHAKKKRIKTDAETACGTANSEDAAASEAEEQYQKSKNKSVGSLDSDHCSQRQIDTQSESGIKSVVDKILTRLFLWFITS